MENGSDMRYPDYPVLLIMIKWRLVRFFAYRRLRVNAAATPCAYEETWKIFLHASLASPR